MNYGDQIKQARIQLGLLQKDLIDSGISRVHITDLESGKSNLVKVKAIKIYEKLTYYSLVKRIPIQLTFDPLLSDNETYQDMKACYRDLCPYLTKDQYISNYDNCRIYSHHINKKIGSMIFFLLSLTGSKALENDDKQLAYKNLKGALISMQYHLKEDIIDYFDDIFYDFKKVCYHLSIGEEVISIYMHLNNFLLTHDMPLRRYTYFNMALFEKISHNYQQALDYLNKQITTEPIISLQDNIDYQITRAAILMHLGHYADAINIYALLLSDRDKMDEVDQLSIVCSNIIHFIVKFDIQHQESLLSISRSILEESLETNKKQLSDRYKAYSNLGQVAFYEGKYTQACRYFTQAFQSYDHQNLTYTIDYLTLIEEALPCFLENDQVTQIISYLSQYKMQEAKDKEKLLYTSILTKVIYKYSGIQSADLDLLLKQVVSS